MLRIVIAVALVFGLAQPVQAKWREAQSDRFVVYSESRADDVRQFAEMLERFHVAMELLTGRKIEKPSPSNRVTVFMVGSDRKLRELYGDRNSNVAGFYVPRASGSHAFVPFIKIGSGEPDFSLQVLLHEYAHHFLIGSSRHAMPRWLSEGSAEFFSSARFPNDGSIQIGLPNNNRATELRYADDVPLLELLDHELYQQNKGKFYDAFYGRSWLLYHYLAFNDARRGQLAQYWRAVAGGMDSTEAAESIFGDLGRLESELKSYFRQRRMSGMAYSAEETPIGKVSVRDVSAGMDAMMPVIMRSKRGVDEEEAAALVVEARAIAGQYPADAGVQAALAEAELDAGNLSEAIAAADRAIAADRSYKPGHVFRGLALFKQAEDADDLDAAYADAMKPFQALNKLENDHPLPLMYYYRSFAGRGEAAPEAALHALERAMELAPFDHSLAMDVALMHAGRGNVQLATYILAPVAANPHGGRRAAVAEALIDSLSRAEEGVPFNSAAIVSQMEDEDADEEGGTDED